MTTLAAQPLPRMLGHSQHDTVDRESGMLASLALRLVHRLKKAKGEDQLRTRLDQSIDSLTQDDPLCLPADTHQHCAAATDGRPRTALKGSTTQSARGLQKLPCHDTKGAQDKGDGGLANHPGGL